MYLFITHINFLKLSILQLFHKTIIECRLLVSKKWAKTTYHLVAFNFIFPRRKPYKRTTPNKGNNSCVALCYWKLLSIYSIERSGRKVTVTLSSNHLRFRNWNIDSETQPVELFSLFNFFPSRNIQWKHKMAERWRE